MTRQYNPKTLLRLVPNDLLREFFERRGLLTDVHWISLRDNQVNLIYDAWQDLPETERAEVERAARSVFDMACEAGIKALVEEGRFHDEDLAADLERLDGLYHKAMWAYLRHERVFEVASLFNTADSLNRRYWLKYRGMPCKKPDTAEMARRKLADGLSEYFRQNQGRGHRCTVECFLRGGRQHYFFAYPDDYADTYIGHGDDGSLVKRPQKKAFEVVFVYAPTEGTLDLYFAGDRAAKNGIAYVFSREVLGENLPPELRCDRVYELDGLLSRTFAFPTDPEDGLEEVRVRKMRLSLAGNGRRRITLEADPGGPVDDIYDLIAEYLSETCLSPGTVHVTQAAFQFRFASCGKGRPRTMSFEVSFPNSSDLKSLAEDERLLGEKYLKRWGIDRD